MNKLLAFPLFILLVLTLLQSFSDFTYTDSFDGIGFNGSEGDVGVIEQEYDGIDLWSSTGLIALLLVAIMAATATGFNLFASGMSDYSQKLIFNSTLYLGTYAILTIGTYNVLIGSDSWGFGLVVWAGLTVMFALGFISDVNASDDG